MYAKGYKKKFSRSGFTLIELLVVLIISSVLFGLGYANFREYSRNQELKNVVEKIKLDIRKAQGFALSGKKPEDLGCLVLDGYKFEVGASDKYSILAICNNNGSEFSVDLDDIETQGDYSLSPSGANVLFEAIGHGTDLDSDLTVTVTQSVTERSVNIVVTPGGEIK